MRGNVTEVNIEAMFPHEFAGICVETHHTFLQRLALADRVLQVDAIAHDDGRWAPTVRSSPGEIVTGWRPLRRQVLLTRDPIACWSTPFGPIARRGERER